MIKAVNMKSYKFGKRANIMYSGFGMLDTETNTFVSFDGVTPYVLTTKKIIQSCIDGLKFWQSMRTGTLYLFGMKHGPFSLSRLSQSSQTAAVEWVRIQTQNIILWACGDSETTSL